MTRGEVQTAIDFAAAEGWNPGLADAECFRAADPEGFFCAESGGRIVGTVSVVNYNADFSFAGLFVVAPEFREQGIGMQLYRNAMAHAGSRVVGGDGVIGMVEKYEKDGGLFLHYQNARYEGTGGGTMPAGLTPVSDVRFSDLVAYDAAHFPASRENFLRCWISRPGHYGLAQRDKSGNLTGYGVRRACGTGHKIGPLFAQDRATAEKILDGLLAGIPSEPFFLDIPVINPAATALVRDRGVRPVFFTARLYSTKEPVVLPFDEIFGITTFELG